MEQTPPALAGTREEVGRIKLAFFLHQVTLDRSKWRMDRSIFWQAYKVLDAAGPEGLTQIELGQRMGKYCVCNLVKLAALDSSIVVVSRILEAVLQFIGDEKCYKQDLLFIFHICVSTSKAT